MPKEQKSMSGHTSLPRYESVPREGWKESIESIVVALILAFVFRAFVVEAFVIPTGSMAPTLYGAHGTIICEDCGTEFAYGMRDLSDHRNMRLVRFNNRAVCPNCNHVNTNLQTNDEAKNPETGDRILVWKWPFDIGGPGFDPMRWDVTVFKDPADGTTNFIKRLVGLPNEVLTILDGDVYTAPTSELSEATLRELEQIRHEKYELRTGARRGVLRPISRQAQLELNRKLHIARKPPQAQQALWSLVYDHNYPPRTLDRGQPRWVAPRGKKSGWDASTRHVRFEGKGTSSDYIALTGKAIRASNAYNIYSRPAPPVTDLSVRFVWTPGSTDAGLWIRLEKLGRAFWGGVTRAGLVTLVQSRNEPDAATPTMLSKQLSPFSLGKAIEISFENVDYRLSLRVGKQVVLASSDKPDSKSFYGPDFAAVQRRGGRDSSSSPRLYGLGGSFELTHLVVDRDIYYYHDPGTPGLALSWAPRGGWASPEYPILLRKGEYFMLGDNTAASKDSRLWDEWGSHLDGRGEAFQLGTVPKDQLIGKAFFVYWPSPYRVPWMPIIRDKIGLIPDVGRMRWIR